MEALKQRWRKMPPKIRQSLVLVIGGLFVLGSALVGLVPGPGGTIVFLIGVAVLATEFSWAEAFRDMIMRFIKDFFDYLKRHRLIATAFWTLVALWLSLVIWYFFIR